MEEEEEEVAREMGFAAIARMRIVSLELSDVCEDGIG